MIHFKVALPLVHLEVIGTDGGFDVDAKGLDQLTERRSLMRFRFPAVGHQSTDEIGSQFRFRHSITVFKATDKLVVHDETGVWDFGQRKDFP